METTEIKQTLEGFTGTTQYYMHYFPQGLKILLTDGCDYIREKCEAYWLFDAILSFQLKSQIREEPFQVWKLQKQPDNSWELLCEDGNKKVIAVQAIEYSDFPLDEIIIWLVDGVAMLPSEY
jgi:hypothetical protein